MKEKKITDACCIDQFVLWPITISKPIWCRRPNNREKDHPSKLAIGIVKLGRRWPVGRPVDQRLHSGQIRLSTNDDGIYGVDGCGAFHPRIRPFAFGPSLW
jgi:hypothetical protein